MLAHQRAGHLVLGYDLALIAISLNERSVALDWLQLAVKDRSMSIYELNTEPLLHRFRGDPRFERIRREYQQGDGPAPLLIPPRSQPRQ
jgi:hypothetical protein